MSIEEVIRATVREELHASLEPYLKKLCKPEPKVYSAADVAIILQISDDTVRRMVDDGTLPHVPHIGRTLIPRWAVDELVSRSTTR